MQWTSHFFEVVIVASCNEYLSLPKESKKKTNLACASALRYSSGLDSSIALFGAASCSQLDVSKSRGLLVQTQPLASPSVAALYSISFITGQQTIKHLTPFSMTSRCLFGHLRLCFWHMSLVHMTGFDLFGVYVLNILSMTIASWVYILI